MHGVMHPHLQTTEVTQIGHDPARQLAGVQQSVLVLVKILSLTELRLYAHVLV
jgi:hypothetical protein